MKEYIVQIAPEDVDDHWKCVVLCRECKYVKREMLAPWFRVWLCDQHKLQVTPEFWCAYGEKKGEGK